MTVAFRLAQPGGTGDATGLRGSRTYQAGRSTAGTLSGNVSTRGRVSQTRRPMDVRSTRREPAENTQQPHCRGTTHALQISGRRADDGQTINGASKTTGRQTTLRTRPSRRPPLANSSISRQRRKQPLTGASQQSCHCWRYRRRPRAGSRHVASALWASPAAGSAGRRARRRWRGRRPDIHLRHSSQQRPAPRRGRTPGEPSQ